MNNQTNKLIPELRFPEFVNEGEWKEMTISEILVEGKLGGNYENIESTEGIPVIKMGNIERGKINLDKIQYLPIKAPYNIDEVLKTGDLLFNTRNTLELVGKVAIWRSELPFAIYNSNLMRMTFSEKFVASNFFMNYFFNTELGLKKLKSIATGTTSVAAIYTKDLLTVKVVITSKEEQKKIAACLSSLDEVIAAQSQKLAALKEHKKGLMQNLFPQEGETVPKWRFPEFVKDGEWEEKKLGGMTIKVGSGVTPLGGESNYKKIGRPFVRSQNVSWGVFLLNNIAFIDEVTHQNSISTEIALEDILLNITGASIGRSAVANELVAGGNVNQHVCIIRTQKNILNPFFVNQFLISDLGQKQIDSFQAGGNRQGLNFEQIRSFIIPIAPKLTEQQKIAACLSSLDSLITAQSEKIEQLKLHKKGLMQGLFPKNNE